jgi:hypothetical protein
MIEAEFHVVWVDSKGKYRDVTPRDDTETRILFLPDPQRVFDGRLVNNVRVPLSKDSRILEFVQVADAVGELVERCHRVGEIGTQVPYDEMAPLMRRKMELQHEIVQQLMRTADRNDPCPCGSRKKFKKCHGRSATSSTA